MKIQFDPWPRLRLGAVGWVVKLGDLRGDH